MRISARTEVLSVGNGPLARLENGRLMDGTDPSREYRRHILGSRGIGPEQGGLR